MNIGIIGGDLRIIRLAEMYAKENNRVYTYGLEKYFDLKKQDGDEKLDSKVKEINVNKERETKKTDKKLEEKNNSETKMTGRDQKEKKKNILQCSSIKEVITNSEIIISSMPFSKDGVYVNAPFSKEKIEILDLEKALFDEINNKHKLNTIKFIAGGIPKNFLKDYSSKALEKNCGEKSDLIGINKESNLTYVSDEKDKNNLIFINKEIEDCNNVVNDKFKTADIKIIDLLESERLTILNAIATVEGTIKIAIQEREETIFESNVLVCGFGRIGKIMCDRFRALGANIYCTARKEKDLTWIREKRYIPLTYDKVAENGEKFDLVINTVPTMVLKEKEINSFKQDVLIIDVASNPGGVDKDYAMQKNIKVITALGIPGKEMPKAAARFIKEETLTF